MKPTKASIILIPLLVILTDGEYAALSVEGVNDETERFESAVFLVGVLASNDGRNESRPESGDGRRLLQLQLSHVGVGSAGSGEDDEEYGR